MEAIIPAGARRPFVSSDNIVPHPTLIAMFHERIDALHEALDDQDIRAEAAEIIYELIENVIIHPARARGPEAEVVLKQSNLAAFALYDNAAPGGGAWSST